MSRAGSPARMRASAHGVHAGAAGAWVGTAGARPVARFARDARLERLLAALQAGFGPQRWWPAESPFEVVVGAVLTQNTAWRNVELALASLRARTELTPAALLALERPALAEAIRPSGSYNVKAERLAAVCRWLVAVGGFATLRRAPLAELRADLLRVHGVGPETADSILCYSAGRPTPVVDAYARRVLERHALVAPGLSYAELRSWLLERLLPAPIVLEEFHALCVRAGTEHCKPRPRCESCPAPAPPPLAGPEPARKAPGAQDL